MNENKIKELDNKDRKECIDILYKKSQEIRELIDNINEAHTTLNFNNEHIPNIAITINNKIVELHNIYKSNNIYLFYKNCYLPSEYSETLPVVEPSYIGYVIISDLNELFTESINFLNAYWELIDSPRQKGLNLHFLTKLCRRLNVPVKEAVYSDEELIALKTYLKCYKNIDDQIFNYNLKDTIINSIAKTMLNDKVSAKEAAEIIEDDIVFDLQKLGMSDLIPKLKNKLISSYYEIIKNNNNITEKTKYKYIPDFDMAKKIRATMVAVSENKNSVNIDGVEYSINVQYTSSQNQQNSFKKLTKNQKNL